MRQPSAISVLGSEVSSQDDPILLRPLPARLWLLLARIQCAHHPDARQHRVAAVLDDQISARIAAGRGMRPAKVILVRPLGSRTERKGSFFRKKFQALTAARCRSRMASKMILLSGSIQKNSQLLEEAMALKPVIDVRHRGKRVRVEFARDHGRMSIRYDIIVNDKLVKARLFAEEVMRWLGHAMEERPVESDATSPR